LSKFKEISVTIAIPEPPSVTVPVKESKGSVVVGSPVVGVVKAERSAKGDIPFPRTPIDPVTIPEAGTVKDKVLNSHPVKRW
jgi:hypothetical protein